MQDVESSATRVLHFCEEKSHGLPEIILSFEVAPLVLLVWRHVVVHHLLLAHLDIVGVSRLLAARPWTALLRVAVTDDLNCVVNLPSSSRIGVKHAENHVHSAR
jgi:hypothetical protein